MSKHFQSLILMKQSHFYFPPPTTSSFFNFVFLYKIFKQNGYFDFQKYHLWMDYFIQKWIYIKRSEHFSFLKTKKKKKIIIFNIIVKVIHT